MPRIARVKSPSSIVHVMVRSISDINLFKTHEDKEKYLELVQRYKNLFFFKIYAYCLMSNHAHFIINCNGADISKFMKCINQCYTSYFNKKYNRHGHLFQDRFKSKIIDSDKYLLVLSAYIHNNPKDIKQYKDDVKRYKYSSLGIYLGLHNDTYKVLTLNFILQYFGNDVKKSKELYLKFVNQNNDNDDESEFISEVSEYKTEQKILLRNFKPEDILNFIKKRVKVPFNINIKYNHANSDIKSVCVVIIRSLCDLKYKELRNIIGNLALSSISRLCQKGLNLISTNEKYNYIIEDFIKTYAVAQ